MKKKSLSQLKKILWKLVATHVKKLGEGICFTCNKAGLSGSNYHCGHFIKSSVCGVVLRYDIRNLRGQCAFCNLWLDGNQYEFGKRLGENKVKELYEIRADSKGKTWDRETYEKLIAKYKSLTR